MRWGNQEPGNKLAASTRRMWRHAGVAFHFCPATVKKGLFLIWFFQNSLCSKIALFRVRPLLNLYKIHQGTFQAFTCQPKACWFMTRAHLLIHPISSFLCSSFMLGRQMRRLPPCYRAGIESLDVWEAGSHVDLDFILPQSLKLITNPSVTRLTHLCEQVLVRVLLATSSPVVTVTSRQLRGWSRKTKENGFQGRTRQEQRLVVLYRIACLFKKTTWNAGQH